MTPTLLTGDFIFVNKFAYGLRLPVINTKVVELGEPQRGDVVVFRLPSDPSVNYVKRVVGLPGDVVDYHPANKRLTINGESDIDGDGRCRTRRSPARCSVGSSSASTGIACC